MNRRFSASAAEASRVRLLLLERGTSSGQSVPAPDPAHEIAVVIQGPEEVASAFAANALRRIAHIQSSGRRIPTATIAVDAECTEDAFASRCLIANAILLHFVTHGSGELVLSAPVDAKLELRHALFEFAEALIGDLQGEQISIRVRFGDATHASGPSLNAERGPRQRHASDFAAAVP